MYVNLESRSIVGKKNTEMIDSAKTAHGGSEHSNRGRMSVASDAEPVFAYTTQGYSRRVNCDWGGSRRHRPGVELTIIGAVAKIMF